MPLNLYGDDKKILSEGCGSDISSQRTDDLDKSAINFARDTKTKGSFVDLGSGHPVQASRFASFDHDTLAIDLMDFSTDIKNINASLSQQKIRFLCKRLEDITTKDLPEIITCLFSQRTIHYLKPEHATKLIEIVSLKMHSGAKAFISASGIFSELSSNYEGKHIEWTDRYAPLSSEMQQKHGIEGNVCLYSEDDLTNLFTSHGFSVEKIYTSDFGNIKGIFIKN